MIFRIKEPPCFSNFFVASLSGIFPTISKMRINPSWEWGVEAIKPKQQSYLNILESHIHDIISPFQRKLTSKYLNLTASEMQVANLVMDGKRTKEIALLLNLSEKTIEVHRKNIREKLGIKNKKTNLRTHLLALK